jgi:hypothetical protein
LDVVVLCAEKKMMWVHAKAIIAMVAYEKAFRYGAVG